MPTKYAYLVPLQIPDNAIEVHQKVGGGNSTFLIRFVWQDLRMKR